MEIIKVHALAESVNFWKGLKLYYEQPKSINKQVLFSKSVVRAELLQDAGVTDCQAIVNYLYSKLSEGENVIASAQNSKCCELKTSQKDVNEVFTCSKGMFLLCRKLIPKLCVPDNLEFYEFIFLDKSLCKVHIFTKYLFNSTCDSKLLNEKKELDVYVILKFNLIQLHWCSEFLEVSYNQDLSEKGITWLKSIFIPKLTKLSNSVICERTNKKQNKLQFEDRVDIVKFYQLYEEMKTKYGKYFVENWTENTDPKKFVYEDIAIATYLMLLWSKNNSLNEEKKQRFVDLGCGNGLLVHILNSEGHLGIGLDIRKRKIWDIYPSYTKLIEQTIIPSTETTYPDADWLIGNHSDELTAWIPIMARLSNNHCQYFVLPCCPYQLNGMKYQRKNTNLSCYEDFIGYLKQVSEISGFETFIDKLRIPSTKRICLVGLNNVEMSKLLYSSLVKSTLNFAQQEIQSSTFSQHQNYNHTENQCPNIKIRKAVEAVRNCTRLSQELIDNTLKCVMNELLKDNNIYMVSKDGEQVAWNRGGRLSIKELALCLDEQLLKELRKECKGLQTLLKNQHFIFEVSQGQVQFRKPKSLLEISKKILSSQNKEKWKKRKCWFFDNHPDKCPLGNDICSYSHEM